MNKKISYIRVFVYVFLGLVIGYYISTELFLLGSQDIIFNPIISYILAFLMVSMPFILAIIGGFIGFKISRK